MAAQTMAHADGATLPTGSPILAIHARYEQAWTEYLRLEKEEFEEKDGSDRKHRLQEAMKVNQREHDGLRLAILYQVPESWQEALVLTYHIEVMHDLTINSTARIECDVAALSAAIETLFDFMCCEVRQSHEALGALFQDAACRVFTSRRLRTGIVE